MTTSISAGRPAVLRVLPWHLTVAWLTVSLLYLVHASWLPSPIAAFLLSTLVGTVAAILLVVTARAGADRTAAPARRQHTAGAPSEGIVMAGPDRPSAPVAPFSSDGRSGPGVGRADHGFQLDPARYPFAAADEQQCPHCGGFEVRLDAPGSARCRTCSQQWRTDTATIVSVRSWLHQR